MALDPMRQALAEALDVCASVSKANLAKRGNILPWTIVEPYALRRLADALEVIVPGAIDSVRAEKDRRRAEAAALREEQARRVTYTRDGETVAASESGAIVLHDDDGHTFTRV